MRVKGGCQVPNGSFTPSDVVDVFGNGVYIVMQGELDKVGGPNGLRALAPEAFIILRFYLENWYKTNPVTWANQCWEIWQQNKHLVNAFTWANEQNLKDESGGSIGSSPGDMIKPGQWEIIRDWNLAFLNRWDELERNEVNKAIKVFPATAMGNSDDQDDGAGIGLEIQKPVIDRCELGAVHAYWNPSAPLADEWYGLGRLLKQKKFFGDKKVVVTETGDFAVAASNADSQYLSAYYYMQNLDWIYGFCFFIFADPTKHHQLNDMSRNTKIFDAIKSAIKIERPQLMITTPVPIPPVEVDVLKVPVGLQIWQYNEIDSIATLPNLLAALDQVGATILSDKFADGDGFQGTWDDDPLAVRNAAVMAARHNWCRLNGLEYIPWHVPRAIPGDDYDAFEGAKREGQFVGNVCGNAGLSIYVSDLEFYAGFFGYAQNGTSFFANNEDRNTAARLHYSAIRSTNPNLKIILQPDPRQDTHGPGGIDIVKLVTDGLIDGVIYQSYAPLFLAGGDTRTHKQIIEDSIRKGVGLGIPWGVCLYCDMEANADSSPDQATELFNLATAVGASWVFIYKAPVTRILQPIIKSYAGGLDMPDPTDTIDMVQNEAWTAGEKLKELARRAELLRYPWLSVGLNGAGDTAKSLAVKNKGDR